MDSSEQLWGQKAAQLFYLFMRLITWFKASLVHEIYVVKLVEGEVENPGPTGCTHDVHM